MRKYIGTETLYAKPMTRGNYNAVRGWTVPNNENPLDEGYIVERREVGHVSWMPKDVFEKTYSEVTDDHIELIYLKHDLLTNKYTGVYHEKDFNYNAPHYFQVHSLVGWEKDKTSLVGEVHFQEGPIKEVGVNGVNNEDLIAMVICRLEHFNQTEFRSRDNSMAITKLEEALLWLRKRTIGRENRGVEGTYVK